MDMEYYGEGRAAYGENVKYCYMPMKSGVRIVHSKLMLLFHRHYVRIVVATANTDGFDWGEAGCMENVWFH